MVIYLQRLKEFLIWGEAFPDIGYRISWQLDCNGICISLYRIPTYNHFTVHASARPRNLLEKFIFSRMVLKSQLHRYMQWTISPNLRLEMVIKTKKQREKTFFLSAFCLKESCLRQEFMYHRVTLKQLNKIVTCILSLEATKL